MTFKWLEVYLTEAVRKKLCTKIHCTTCGALEFRRGLLKALSIATDQHPRQHLDREAALAITNALANVTLHGDVPRAMEDAVRCLLFDLWTGIPLLDSEIEALLAGTWAGNVLQGMKVHHETREVERRAREAFQDPTDVKERREEKKRLKKEQHEKRLAHKKERDLLWHEKYGKAD